MLPARWGLLATAAVVVSVLAPDRVGANPRQAPDRTKAPVVYQIRTSDPVVFITIDDGWYRQPEAARLIREWGWPVTSFVLTTPLQRGVAWFRNLGPSHSFGVHGRTHASLKNMSYERQERAICQGAKDVKRLTGKRARFLRPPYGAYNRDTLRAAKTCGLDAVVMWSVSVRGRRIGARINAGDIILLHYVQSLPTSLRELKKKLDRKGLTPAPLADYIE